MAWGKAERQDCVWHILARVRAEAKRAFGDSSPLVGQTVQGAREVLIHDTRTEETRVKVAEKIAEFAKKHEGHSWGNTVARDFARATTYLHSPDLPRTNGTVQHTIKEIRRRAKTMDGFK